MTRAANHELAGLISFAVHLPKKIPEYKPVGRRRGPIGKPTEAGHDIIKAYFKKLARGSTNGKLGNRGSQGQPRA
jgi:hypothetical protein